MWEMISSSRGAEKHGNVGRTLNIVVVHGDAAAL